MKTFSDKISLVKNGRGCYILDPIKGCSICAVRPSGCYGDCYAKRIADRYKIDFSNIVRRNFEYEKDQPYLFNISISKQRRMVIEQIKKIDMPFIRMGDMGDPSWDWEHTINICSDISVSGKQIVIITKHWRPIKDSLLNDISKLNLCINTSVSALDSQEEIDYRLSQYDRLKPYCNSVLRIVSCDFNLNNNEGANRAEIQNRLFEQSQYIDTVFRPSKTNRFVTDGVINVSKVGFLRSKVLASMYNQNTYLGMCNDCPDMCGVNYV